MTILLGKTKRNQVVTPHRTQKPLLPPFDLVIQKGMDKRTCARRNLAPNRSSAATGRSVVIRFTISPIHSKSAALVFTALPLPFVSKNLIKKLYSTQTSRVRAPLLTLHFRFLFFIVPASLKLTQIIAAIGQRVFPTTESL